MGAMGLDCWDGSLAFVAMESLGDRSDGELSTKLTAECKGIPQGRASRCALKTLRTKSLRQGLESMA